MTHEEAMKFIEDSSRFGSKLGLESIRTLLEYLENPQDALKYIHVAGTNGKGSTSSFLNSVLVRSGFNVGLYTSPHLITFNEGIKINSVNIKDEEIAKSANIVKNAVDKMLADGHQHPTQYEIVTAISFEYFKAMKVDIVILEVGMGGRLDATNVIGCPLVSIITPIAMDHVGFLGDTIEKVAAEKAGIIKPNCDVVVARQDKDALKVIEDVSKELNANLYNVEYESIKVTDMSELGSTFNVQVREKEYEDLHVGLIGQHQIENALVALTAIEVLKKHGFEIHDLSIKLGLKETKWAGRLELIQEKPRILIDGAHNLHGAKALSRTIDNVFNYNKLVAVIGILSDKDIDGVFAQLLPLCDEIIFTKPANPRACDPRELIKYGEQYGIPCIVEEDIIRAYEIGKSKITDKDMLLCCGSLYMIGSIRDHVISKA